MEQNSEVEDGEFPAEEAVYNAEWSEAYKTKRGITLYDRCSTILARATVPSVVQALMKDYPTAKWEPDIVERTITVGTEGFLIFLLEGHTWSTVLYHHRVDALAMVSRGIALQSALQNDWAQSLSRHLDSRVIHYAEDDTSGWSSFKVFQSGKLVNKPFLVGQSYDQLLKAEDALEPGMDVGNILGYPYWPGHQVLVEPPSQLVHVAAFSPPQKIIFPLERVDYLVLAP